MAKRSDEQLYNLPETSAASRGARHKLDALLREAHSLRDAEKRLKQVREEIREIIQQQDLVSEDGTLGVRHGEMCCVVRYQQGRRTLDRELLVENGVTPAQIEGSFKEGAPFYVCEFHTIGEGE